MDLIERQAAIAAVGYYSLHSGDKLLFADKPLKRLPSVQPEIIRCKDCLYWIPGYITEQDDFIPPKCGKYQQMVGHSGDDFCSLAKMDAEADHDDHL